MPCAGIEVAGLDGGVHGDQPAVRRLPPHGETREVVHFAYRQFDSAADAKRAIEPHPVRYHPDIEEVLRMELHGQRREINRALE